MSLFFRAKLSCNIFIFILTNFIKADELKKNVRSAYYLNTQPRQLSLLQVSKPCSLGCYLSTNPTHPVSCTWVGISLVSFNQPPHPPAVSFNWVEQVPAIHHQIKLRIINQHRRSENQERLSKFVWTLRGCRWVQGISAGTKAPVPCRVQAKERSPLWVPYSWSP